MRRTMVGREGLQMPGRKCAEIFVNYVYAMNYDQGDIAVDDHSFLRNVVPAVE